MYWKKAVKDAGSTQAILFEYFAIRRVSSITGNNYNPILKINTYPANFKLVIESRLAPSEDVFLAWYLINKSL